MTPTARALAKLKKDGWTAAVVEKWIPQTRQRLDLFGGIDIVAVYPVLGVRGIQVTSASNASARVKKLCAEPRLKVWVQAGCRLEVWGWAKKGAKGKRKLWQVNITSICLEDFTCP